MFVHMKHIIASLLLCSCLGSACALAQKAVIPASHSQSSPDTKTNRQRRTSAETNPANQSTSFTSIELQPTVAYLRDHGAAARMVRIRFHGGSSYKAATVYTQFNGREDSTTLPASTAGMTDYELALPGPPVEKDAQLFVRLVSDGQTYTARCIIAPARQWKVYLMPHSHVDVGYTNVQAKVLAIHMNNIDEAIKIAARTANYPVEARFKWNTEALWVVDKYLSTASNEKKQAFKEAVQKGWINLDGAYANTNTSATSSAQLLQLFSTGARLAKDYGMQIHTMFQGDVPGASWGLISQSNLTGVHYFLSAPNANDRIGSSGQWRDKPFYWRDASGQQQVLFWQSSPYSIGYTLKGSKIPNFFTVEDPKPYYTGKPSDNFLNPYLFDYLSQLEQKTFPYNMTLLTWAMSDNAPIDPELPDAVKAWNERYASPQLVITSVKQFFQDFETAWKDKIPVMSGDYTEYWTDGIASGARETAINRQASDRLQQAGAIWAIRNKPGYPADSFHNTWLNLLMFNEHTWGAYNSVSEPQDPKAIAQWRYKQAFALNAQQQSIALLDSSTNGAANAAGDNAKEYTGNTANAVDVFNTLGQPHTAVVLIPAALSQAGDQVKDSQGKKLPSQRLSTGELAFLATALPPFSKQRFTIHAGPQTTGTKATVTANSLDNGLYTIRVDPNTGNITELRKKGYDGNLADAAGLNQYSYMPGDSAEKVVSSAQANIRIKEKGPLVVSLLITTPAPGANSLTREIRLAAGSDQITLINTLDKKAIGDKESVHFVFPFHVPGAQVRYSIPWGSIRAEADQLPYTNRNWYTQQRWVDVSNKNVGVTWSSPDAPLFEIGQYPTAGLLGGLHNSPRWLAFTEQQPLISSWVMNNLWHTNFRRDQEGPTTFHYYLQVHGAYDAAVVNRAGLEHHQPPVVTAASGPASERLFFDINGGPVYVENLYPAADGNGVLLQLVNSADHTATVTLTSKNALSISESDLLETNKKTLSDSFEIPAKGILMIRVARK
ncbi:glycoside hydrolase family 38 N-terminal domain-containing protein [Chitinophaga arvensicola]|uniref:Glycosyl hydrolases family 38 C-terminal domain-containing protein n=1 Tax=Chitinophaga arvensicola TaxID=29529 RepID=A0A1I0SAJ1_9BACT|nr:glycoside hydrolase family 38 C-terminal domain-containing protein [Chitinophaga arvensicola]SEW53434.1 Glycosyl hydrolases family 38 C-terminal domain-containing protein [Chitinophaga arvensicola]